MQRVLFVDHATVLGGAEHSLLLCLKELNRDLIDPILACPPGKLANKAQEYNTRVISIVMPRLRHSLLAPWHFLKGALQIARLARENHCHSLCSNTKRASIYTLLAARLAGMPMVWYVRDVFENGAYLRCLSHRAAAIIAVSNAAAAPIQACGARVAIINNGIDLSDFDLKPQEPSCRARWNIPPTAHVVGIVGRIRSTKGQHHFLRAFAQAAMRDGQLWGVVIGDTLFEGEEGYAHEIRELCQELGISGRIVFTGYVNDIPHALQALDVLVSSSLVPESFGRTIVEAMASGLGVISYDHGGPSEIIHDGIDGYLVTPGNIEKLAESIALLASRPDIRTRMGQAARVCARNYELSSVTRKVENALLAVNKERKDARCT